MKGINLKLIEEFKKFVKKINKEDRHSWELAVENFIEDYIGDYNEEELEELRSFARFNYFNIDDENEI